MFKLFTKLSFLWVILLGALAFGQISNRPSDDLVRRAMLQSAGDKVLTNEDLNYELTDFYTNTKNGIQHIYLRQSINELEVIGTESSIHISSTGKISHVNNKFTNSILKRVNNTDSTPQISQVQAVNYAAMHLGYPITQTLQLVSQANTADRKSVVSNGGMSLSDIPVKLLYYLNEEGNLNLVWELSIESTNQTEWYNVRVNAKNGQIIDKVSWANSCNFDHDHSHDNGVFHFTNNFYTPFTPQFNFSPNVLGTYNVFAMPLESPYYGGRTMLAADDVVNFNASPYGWHDTNGVSGPEYTTTRGNNVNAYEDGDNPGFQPDGGSSLVFDFPFNINYSSGNQSESAAITNLFYWNNIIHDVFYEYGFDEVSGNFQQNNYGNGGLGNDFVNAEAQDNSGTCNANFYTPPDGSNPRMQMYICGNKDGDFDNMVIVHEYGHGISNRLTGGPSNSNCLNNTEQMGEGWSDFFGLMLTMNSDDQPEDPRGVGTYLFGQGAGGPGIRTYPYSTNMGINPHTYDSIKTEAVPHGVGSVWCAMLWEMTWGLIDEYGFDTDFYNGTGGNNIAIQLVVEGLKLQPCSPGFVDGRDAILQADQLLYGGANQCIIWDAFAKRGLGYSASQGSSNSRTDGVEAFDTPSATAAFTAPADVCEDKPVMTGLSGGTPIGGVYSGPGVTDDGNGITYSFDPAVAGVGVHTITYSVPASECAAASSASDEIEVTAAMIMDCPEDIEVDAVAGECTAEVTFTTPEAIRGCAIPSLENFDAVGVPNLPEGWTTQTDQGTSNNWVTVTTQSSSAPNSAYAASLSSISLSSLNSPDYDIASTNAKLKFDLWHNCENGYDGAVLEYSENGGSSWSDILNGGGTFAANGYTHTLSTAWSNPLGGRQAWSGNSGAFKAVVVNLDASMEGKSVKFRWRSASDVSFGAGGIWVDNVEVEGVAEPEPIVVTQIEGLPSGSDFPVGTNVVTFQADDGTNTYECSFNIIVNDNIAPEIECPSDMTVSIPAGGSFTLPDYWASGAVTATDNCSSTTDETQSPVAGSAVGPGVHTIEFSVADTSGNTATCSFQLTVIEDGTSEACFAVDFSDITTGNSTSTNGSSSQWGGNADFPTVERAYQAGGAVRIGASGNTGFIESRDLDEVEGDITVNIMVKGWTIVEGDLIVSIDGQQETLTYTAVMAGDFEQVSASFTGVAAGSNLRIATSSKRAFIDDVEIICDETQEEGCLDSTYGQYPSNTYTPYCIGVTEEITTEGYAGEYSKVNLTAGVEYTFSSSVSTDYITISDTNGTVVLISGTTPVVYTPSANEEVRFYTHVDEDCTPEASLRARMVQCGEPVIVDEPDYDCFQGDGIPLSIDDGFAIHNPSNFMVADDFVVDPGTQFTIHQITVDVNQPEIPSTATLNIREDNGGVPGAVVGTATMAPSEAILYGVAYQDPVYHLVFDLDTPIVLPEGTYYLQTQMSVPSATVVWWVVTESGTTGNPALVSYDNGASWEVFDSAYDMAFFVAGDCEPVSSEDDCDQGDDSAGDDVTVALQIGTGTDFSHADDFFVSPGNTLNVKQIELNYVTLNGMPADSWTFTFYEDDGGLPGSVEVASVSPTEFTQVQIGIMFGAYPLYAVFAEVDLNFTEGHYWMMPVAQAANGDTGSVFWETTPFGTLGEIIAEFDATVGNWVHYADEDVQGVFKLHCEPVDPPEEQCLFDITISVEPITRVVLSDIDNTSSAVVNGSPALEDFTSIVGHLAPGTTYEVALEGNTDGAYTNYFTLWIDFDQSGTYDSNEMFEIGSIYNSTGQDGQQAVNTIQIPSDAPLGTTTMRVIKNFSTSPTNPCGQYSFGQGEDYTIEIVELEDCSGTPEGGTVTVNPETGNPGSTYTVSASGYSIGNGLSYQWQSNTNGEGWVNEGAASSEYASYIATAPEEVGDEVEWRLEVTCTLSGETALSTIAIFTVEKVYCHPDIVFVEPITRVLLANIDNYSAADSTEPYEDFTSIVGNLTRTLDYEIALEGNTAGPYTNYFTVWIDWNQNGSFESTEMYEIGSIYNSTGEDGQQAVNTIDVPEDALLGITRMRVIKNYSVSPTDPCGNYTFGQVEDYSINVESLGTSDMDINAFAYWPNPTRGVLNIESQKEIKSVEILNLAGQKVMADQKVIDGQINVSQLTSATYVFRVNFADGTIRTFKILKK